jgi:CHAT domain-containing protein
MKHAGAMRGIGNGELSLLPGSKQEVLAAAAAIDDPRDTVLIGSNATKYAFEHRKLAQYRIIHLAVHGFADRAYPDRSALILLSDPSAAEDGFLEASEIVQFRIKANLVILSACDTGVGPIEGEEGISTLARAFLLAGAKSVISTLWSIDDTYSYVLMKHFYEHLAKGDHPAAALAEAKRDMLTDLGQRALPYYWAGFIFEGPVE